MIIEHDNMINMNDDTSTCVPNLGDKNTNSSILEDSNTLIPKLEDVYIHLVNAFLQFLNREKGKNKENLEFISKVNAAISNLSGAFHLADSRSNQLQVQDNIEHIFFMAVRYDMLKAHIEEIAKNDKQCVSNTSEKAASMVLVAIENVSEKESNNEKSGSIDDPINYKTTTEIQNNEKNSKDKEMQRDPGGRMQVFLHCDVCKKTFQEEKELKEHKEFWRGSSSSCASGARDALEHQKSCTTGNKTNSIGECVKTLSQSNELNAHKRGYPDPENESQKGERNRSKFSKKNNNENIITELKEEQDGIKEETMEEEGIGDPLSSVDPCLPGRPLQEELHYEHMSASVDENNQQYSEITSDVTKGLKRVLHDNAEILAKVENTESSINILRLQIEQILQYSIANHGKLKQLSKTIPTITTRGRLKTWSNIMELEQQLKEDKDGSLRDHLFLVLRKVAMNNDDSVKMDKKGLKLALNFIFQSPEEACLYTGFRGSKKICFTEELKLVHALLQDVCCEGTEYSGYNFREDLKKYFHNISQETPEQQLINKERKRRYKKKIELRKRSEAEEFLSVNLQQHQQNP